MSKGWRLRCWAWPQRCLYCCCALLMRVPLPHCCAGLLGAWAVHHRRSGLTGMDDGAAAVPSGEEKQYHAYLLLSFQGSTKVLATGEELREVTER